MNPSNARVISGDGKFVAVINQPEINDKVSDTTLEFGKLITSPNSIFLNETEFRRALEEEALRDPDMENYSPPTM